MSEKNEQKNFYNTFRSRKYEVHFILHIILRESYFQALKFHADCLLRTGDHLHEMSKTVLGDKLHEMLKPIFLGK